MKNHKNKRVGGGRSPWEKSWRVTAINNKGNGNSYNSERVPITRYQKGKSSQRYLSVVLLLQGGCKGPGIKLKLGIFKA